MPEKNSVMTRKTETINDWYQSRFDHFEKSLNGESKSELHQLRKNAITKFHELGFPTTLHEEWRFTNIAPIAKTQFMPVVKFNANGVTAKDIQRYNIGHLKCSKLVFIDGHFAKEFSSIANLPKETLVGNLSLMVMHDAQRIHSHLSRSAGYDENGFTALNTAFMQDGAYIFLPDGAIIEDPIYLLFISTVREDAYLSSPRNLIIAGKHSRVAIIENYVGLGHNTYFTNAITEIIAGDHAAIEHDKLQNEGENAYHVSSIHIRQQAGSNYTSNSVAFGGSIVRNNISALLDAEGIECTLNGLSLATGSQLVDNHTTIDHAKPRCNSHELYKSILEGKSRGVFNGKIFVRKDAQKTDAKQTNKTLLLSDDATIDTKPQLEIFADDVKCTHGATVGQLDAEQIFYLRSRGLGLDAARDILTNAFASDVINKIKIEPLREELQAILHVRLCRGRLAASAV
jgi:Fe-S cluster assembly protein SufD